MALLKIPVRNDLPAFSQRVELEGEIYNLSFRYNERMAKWVMGILNDEEAPIVSGILLLTAVPLLDQLTKAGLPPGDFLMLDRKGGNTDAGREEFGENINLFYQESGNL